MGCSDTKTSPQLTSQTVFGSILCINLDGGWISNIYCRVHRFRAAGSPVGDCGGFSQKNRLCLAQGTSWRVARGAGAPVQPMVDISTPSKPGPSTFQPREGSPEVRHPYHFCVGFFGVGFKWVQLLVLDDGDLIWVARIQHATSRKC